MQIPHGLFRFINLVMITLLRSPLHGLFSSSVLAIRYRGVKSGRTHTVPARYLRREDDLVLVTSRETRWWPNFVQRQQAQVLLAGRWVGAEVSATPDAANLAGPVMRTLWTKHPSDAGYMNVRMHKGEPNLDDFARALATAVLITVSLS